MHLESGRLLRFTRDVETGSVKTYDLDEPPSNFPDAAGKKVLGSRMGDSMVLETLHHQLIGVEIICGLDADSGRFLIGIQGAAPRVALNSLPHGVSCRPWARLAHAQDRAELRFEMLPNMEPSLVSHSFYKHI